MTCEPGETKSVKFGRLTHIREGLITADAVITCLIHDDAHLVVDTLTGVADDLTGDWYADFNAPADPGVYHILATCVAEGATLERELKFRVVAFT
jgi:uncharacterized membrane-anchored protein